MKEIKFYSWKRDYFELSNFSQHPIEIGGKMYPTNEHYFQSVKFKEGQYITLDYRTGEKEDYREHIRNASSPALAKKLGRSRKFKIQSDWDRDRLDVMREAVRAKFSQHEDLKKLLVDTGDATLKEDAPNDDFWGIGSHGNGENHLGRILMEVREELK